MVIDSHHHFWRYDETEYGWIPPAWSALRRDFLPEELGREISAAGVDGVISVQARQTLGETEWLLELATRYPFVRGVVGWVPLTAADVEAQLDRLAALPAAAKLRALRHVLQGEPDEAYMLRDDFNRGIRALTRRGLAYDILIFERHLPAAIRLADLHPAQTFIVDHLAKPRIAAGGLEPWATNLRELARRPNVACKLSGMVTEADPRAWSPDQLRPFIDVALAAFGPDRLLFGSDWPVCLAGVSYARWKSVVLQALGALTPHELAAVMGGNAARLYKV